MSEPPFDVMQAHRWFAIECNNQAWDILDSGDRSAEPIDQLLHLAHAACMHWSAIGTSLNRQRALDLLANAYAAAGRGDDALRFARQAFELSEQNAAEQTPFDRAEANGTLSVALRAAGQDMDADVWKHQALSAAETLNDAEQNVIRRLIARGGHAS